MGSYLGIQEVSYVEPSGFQASTADFLACLSLRSLIQKVGRHSFWFFAQLDSWLSGDLRFSHDPRLGILK